METFEERFRAAQASLCEGCRSSLRATCCESRLQILNAFRGRGGRADDLSVLTVQSDAVPKCIKTADSRLSQRANWEQQVSPRCPNEVHSKDINF